MASVVRFAAIVRQELHSVILRHHSRVLLQEVLHFLPECRDSRSVLVQRNGETVNLHLVLHHQERIIMEVAEELDVRSRSKGRKKGIA